MAPLFLDLLTFQACRELAITHREAPELVFPRLQIRWRNPDFRIAGRGAGGTHGHSGPDPVRDLRPLPARGWAPEPSRTRNAAHMPVPAFRVGEKKGSPDARRLTRSLPMRQRAGSSRAPPPRPRLGRLLRNGSRRRRRRVVFRAPPFPPPLSPPPQGPSQADPLRSR